MADYILRPARAEDAPQLAWLEDYCSYGVARLIWSLLQNRYPGKTAMEIGEARFGRTDSKASYRSCVVAERGGELAGMMLSYAMGKEDPELAGISHPALEPYDAAGAEGTFHISSLGIYPAHQGHGIGSAFIARAREQARALGYDQLSLTVFESNPRALALYQRRGFIEAVRSPVVPHQMITGAGDVIFMLAPVDPGE